MRSALTAVARTAGSSPAWRVRCANASRSPPGSAAGAPTPPPRLSRTRRPSHWAKRPCTSSRQRSGPTSPSSWRLGRSSRKAAASASRRSSSRRTTGFSSRCRAVHAKRNGGGVQPLRRDRRDAGFAERKAALLDALAACRRPRDFAAFPPTTSPPPPTGTAPLRGGVARARRVSCRRVRFGAGRLRALPSTRTCNGAARRMRLRARVWVTAPVW